MLPKPAHEPTQSYVRQVDTPTAVIDHRIVKGEPDTNRLTLHHVKILASRSGKLLKPYDSR